MAGARLGAGAAGAVAEVGRPPLELAAHRRPRLRARQVAENIGWYLILSLIALITIFPFLWIVMTSLKGPQDLLFSTPPQLFPAHPSLAAYSTVLAALPIPKFFLNSIVASSLTTVFNVLVSALAAYPLAKMRFRFREPIFYLLLATLIVPIQLTFIPSYLLARFFGYYDSLPAIIWPSLASAFNIFLMRQAFRGVPDELIDAARVDGAGDWRIWWQIAVPLVRPTIATVAIFTFVTSWNDFLWPSLMLPTTVNKTLPVGLAALQSYFSSDFRSIAAGVTMTVIPILIFFVALQRYFVRGLGGALKG
ncbi:MAG TPA: carbohydrate ABC transporter permease [Candidatus Limnocylindrales bacterium]|nr:carbohydrate ABC transporter permease [Candidatus Limnocylindrales bacterium]